MQNAQHDTEEEQLAAIFLFMKDISFWLLSVFGKPICYEGLFFLFDLEWE